jgi:hypothetical protein
MNRLENRKPQYSLTNAESIFINLCKNKRYKDYKHMSKSIIRFKSKFVLTKLEEFEKKLDEMIIKDILHEEIEELKEK